MSALLLHVGAEMFSLLLILQGPQLGPVRIWRCHFSLSRCSSGERAPPVAQSKTLEPFLPPNPLCILAASIHWCPLPSLSWALTLIQPCLGHVDRLPPALCPGFHFTYYAVLPVSLSTIQTLASPLSQVQNFLPGRGLPGLELYRIGFPPPDCLTPLQCSNCQAFKILLGVRIAPLSAWESTHTYLC